MKNDLIENLRELIQCYDIVNTANHAVIREITMWRKRFLASSYDSVSSPYTTEVFLSMPSEEFMKKSPEENFQRNL